MAKTTAHDSFTETGKDAVDSDANLDTTEPAPVAPYAAFPTTRWDLVNTLQKEVDTAKVTAAYDTLCTHYWRPVYCALTRHFSHHEAEDVAQDFFLKRAVHLNLFLIASEEKGKLRTLILRSLQWHINSHLRLVTYSKRRGGRAPHIPLHQEDIDQIAVPDSNYAVPDQAYELSDLAWARELHALLVANLKEEYASAGKLHLFEVLSPRIDELSPKDYSADSKDLNLSPAAARIAVFRMRKRYDLLKQRLISSLRE